MGWDQGAKWLKENAAAGERVDLAKCVTSTYRGETWGLDGNWALMRCIKTKGISDLLWPEPKIPCYDILTSFRSMKKHLDRLEVKLVIVFDGIPHPSKERVTKMRRQQGERSKVLLEGFLKSGNAFDVEKAGREGRNTVKVEPYIIGLVIQWAKEEKIDVRVAPFEADWQLYGLERENLI